MIMQSPVVCKHPTSQRVFVSFPRAQMPFQHCSCSPGPLLDSCPQTKMNVSLLCSDQPASSRKLEKGHFPISSQNALQTSGLTPVRMPCFTSRTVSQPTPFPICYLLVPERLVFMPGDNRPNLLVSLQHIFTKF